VIFSCTIGKWSGAKIDFETFKFLTRLELITLCLVYSTQRTLNALYTIITKQQQQFSHETHWSTMVSSFNCLTKIFIFTLSKFQPSSSLSLNCLIDLIIAHIWLYTQVFFMTSRNRLFVESSEYNRRIESEFFLSRLRSLSMSIVVLHAQCQKIFFYDFTRWKIEICQIYGQVTEWKRDRHVLMDCVLCKKRASISLCLLLLPLTLKFELEAWIIQSNELHSLSPQHRSSS
jgi:hypothetical protein